MWNALSTLSIFIQVNLVLLAIAENKLTFNPFHTGNLMTFVHDLLISVSIQETIIPDFLEMLKGTLQNVYKIKNKSLRFCPNSDECLNE